MRGRSLSAIATEVGFPIPVDIRRAKGWAGQLLEVALGAESGSLAEPDFRQLGVELKSIPVDALGRPSESTYVCTAPMDGSAGFDWEGSWVRRKLSTVLWMPVLGATDSPGQRCLGGPLLWRPSDDETAEIRADWEHFAEAVALGELWQLHGRNGKVLQIRPKAASSSEWGWAVDTEGGWVQKTPIGFYLKTKFTRKIFSNAGRFVE